MTPQTSIVRCFHGLTRYLNGWRVYFFVKIILKKFGKLKVLLYLCIIKEHQNKLIMSNIKLYELKKLQTQFPAEKITTSKSAADFVRQFYTDDIEIFESSFILLLNHANKTIGYAKISQGGITGTVVDVRLIAKYAVESLATSIILCHNHPSGNLTPSQQDINITTKTQKSLLILDIKLLDHIILTADGYTSLADEGYM